MRREEDFCSRKGESGIQVLAPVSFLQSSNELSEKRVKGASSGVRIMKNQWFLRKIFKHFFIDYFLKINLRHYTFETLWSHSTQRQILRSVFIWEFSMIFFSFISVGHFLIRFFFSGHFFI